MANPLQIRFVATANTAPLVTGLNAIRTAAQGSMAGVSTSVVSVQAPLNKLTADIQKGRLSWNDYRRSLRAANSIIAENNAIMKAKTVTFKTATGAAKVHMTVIRGTAASYATLGQQIRFAVTATRAFGKQMIATGKNIQWAGRQVMVGLTLPVVALGVATTKVAEEYNKQMTRIVKVTNLTRVRMEDEFGKMQEVYQAGITDPKVMRLAIESIERQSQSLLNLGSSMGFAAAETSKMAAEFAQMGFAGVALDGLTESALRLARVSGADLPDAMNLTRLAAMAFGKTLGEGPDSLIETFARLNLIENQTSLSLAEMAGAIPIVAGVAKNLGIDIDKLGGMLALMKDKGIDAREGATSLRTGLIRLVQDATEPAIKAFDKLGISIVELQEKHKGSVFGLVNELAGMLHELQNATEGARQKTDEFIAAIGKMVGTRAAARFTSMLEGIGKDIEEYTIVVEGQEVVQYRLIEGLDQTSNAFRAMGPALMETNRALLQFRYEEDRVNQSLAGQAEIIRARLNVQLVRLGEKLLPLRNKIMDFIVRIIEGFNSLSGTTQTLVASIVGIFAVLGPVTMLFGVFANAIGQILVLMTRLFPTFKFTTMAMAAEKAAFAGNTAAVNASTAAKMGMISTNNSLTASTNALTASISAQNAALMGGAGAAAAGRGGAAFATGRRLRSGGYTFASQNIRGSSSNVAMNRGIAQQRSKDIYGDIRGQGLRQQGSREDVTAGKTGALLTPAIIAATMLPQLVSRSGTAAPAAMRAALTPERILQMLPGANEELMRQRATGGESLLNRTRNELAKQAAAQYKGGNQAKFLQSFLTANRVEQAILTAGIKGTGLPQSAREIAGLPQRMAAGDRVFFSPQQRAGLNAQYPGLNVGRSATVGEIEKRLGGPGSSKAAGARAQVERMVQQQEARARYANVSNEQLRAQDRGYANRQAQASATEGRLGEFKNERDKQRAIRREEQRLLRETNRGRSAQIRYGATADRAPLIQRMDRAAGMAASRFDQSREVFKGARAPTTDFQKGLAAGRNAAITALLLFPKLLTSPFKLLKIATVGLVKNFFGLKLAIQAITKGSAALSAFRAAMASSPALGGVRAGTRTLGTAASTFVGNRAARAGEFGRTLGRSASAGIASARGAMSGRRGPRLAGIMGQDWVRARQGIGAPTTARGIAQRIGDRFRGGTAGSAQTDRLVRLRRAHHRQSPLPGMLGLRRGAGAPTQMLESMGRVYRRASEAVASFTAAAVTARGRLMTALAGVPSAMRSGIARGRGRARDILSNARRNIRTMPLMAAAAGTGIREMGGRAAARARRVTSGQAFRESRLGRRMSAVGIPTTMRGMAGRARDIALRRPTAGRMETNQMRTLREALGGHVRQQGRVSAALSQQMQRVRDGFATMSAAVTKVTARLQVMQAALIKTTRTIAASAAGFIRALPSQARDLMARTGRAFRRTPLARERAATGRPNTARGFLGRARDTLLMRPTAGRMETRQQQRLQRALGGPAGPGFMGRRRENVREMGQAISRGFTRAVTVAGERLRAVQAAAVAAATSLRTFAASVITASRAAIAAGISFTKASALALGQAIKRGGARLVSGATRGVTAARDAVGAARAGATGVAAGQTSARGLLGRARSQVAEGFRAREPGARRGLGRLMAPSDRFRTAYDQSMARQGTRAIDRGLHSGRDGGRFMARSAVGKQVAGVGGQTRAIGRGLTVVLAAAIKKAFALAIGAFFGAGLVFTIPLMLSFGAAFMANPEQFKESMMAIFKEPLEALKKTWDDTTAAIRRLFAAFKTGGQGDGSKFIEFAGKVTGVLATGVAAAIQFVLGLVTALIEVFHGLFALMSGEGEKASDLFSKAFLRLRVMMAEVIASIFEMLSSIPGFGTLFGPMLDGGAEFLRNWASDTRSDLEAMDFLPNLSADLVLSEGKVAKATKKTNDERKETADIMKDLLKYQILDQEVYDDLLNSVVNIGDAEADRLSGAAGLTRSARDEALAREEALHTALDQIAGMEMLTDEQKAQLAMAVMNHQIEDEMQTRREVAAELNRKLLQLQNGEVESINYEREKTLALLYLEAQAVAAAAAGDEERAAQIRQDQQAIINGTDERLRLEGISNAIEREAEELANRRLNLSRDANKEIANRIQLNAREQAQYEALQEELDEQLEKMRDFMNAFRSAMGEVMGDIGSAVSRVVEKQIDAIKKLFDGIEEVTNDYFSNFSEQFKNTIDELKEAIADQAEEEERIINELADLAIQKIEDERELEAKLERERQRYFAREKARIDFLAGRRAGTIQVEEAFARGEVGQAAILQIRMQADAQQYYANQLQENEERLMELREEARGNEINRINDERDINLEITRMRREAADAELENSESVVMDQMDLARQAASERIAQANEAIEKIVESEGFLRNEFLRQWNRITPATEQEYREQLGRLESFMNESDERMREETNRIKDEMGQDLAEISASFGMTVGDVVGDLESAIDASGFAISDFSDKLLMTTTNTLLSVLTAFDGFNNGLQAGYANASALSVAFFEMFQRDIMDAVSWADELANIMIGEEAKWAAAGEAAGEGFRREFQKKVDELFEGAERRLREATSRYNRMMSGMPASVTGLGNWQDVVPGNWTIPGERPRPVATGTTNRAGAFGTTLTTEPGRPAVRDWSQSPLAGGAATPWYAKPGAAITRGGVGLLDLLGLSQGARNVSDYGWMSWFTGAPKMHTGGMVGDSLKSDEIPAVLQKGEYVIQKKAVSAAGVDFLNSLNNSSAMFSVPQMRNLNIDAPRGDSTVNSTNTYNLSFNVDGGNIDEQKLAQKVVFEIKKMERAGGGGRRI